MKTKSFKSLKRVGKFYTYFKKTLKNFGKYLEKAKKTEEINFAYILYKTS